MAGHMRNPLLQEKCQFCASAENNELSLGAKKRLEDVVTHYYCLLLSSKMEQNGEDTDGLLGFMLPDIRRELSRGKRLNCIYCKKMGATIDCKHGKCNKKFHLPCGIKNGSLHQFFGHFKSFCPEHRPTQKIPPKLLKEMADGPPTTCAICYDDVPQRPSRDTVWAPCCKKGAWFHRECTQKLANSAGYFFKCPLCNNKEEFGRAMQDCGIYIPEQDASWETVPNAYEELLHRHDQCDHPKCRDPKGRSNDEKRTCWELVLCDLCGSQGVHIKCGALDWSNPEWECAGCKSMLKEAGERRAADASDANIEVDSEPSSTPSSTPSPAPPQSPVASSSKAPLPTSRSIGDGHPLLSHVLGSPASRSLRSRDVNAATDVNAMSGDVNTMSVSGGTSRVPTMLAMETAQARNSRPPAALRGQKARRGLNRSGIDYGGRIKQDVDDVWPAVPPVDNAEVIDLLTDSDEEVVIIDDDLPQPAAAAVKELVTNDGSKIQVVQVVAEESSTEVAVGDVKVAGNSGSLMSIFNQRRSLTVTTMPIEDDVMIIDSDSVSTPVESKYSVGVMKSNGSLRREQVMSARGGRRRERAGFVVAGKTAGSPTKSVLKSNPETTIEPIAAEPVPQTTNNTPRRRPSQVLQNVAKKQGGDSPQRLVPCSTARQVSHSSKTNTTYSYPQSAQRTAQPMSNPQLQTAVPNATQNTMYNQQFGDRNYTLTSDQYKTDESYQFNASSAAPNYSYSFVSSPVQSPKRSRVGPVQGRDRGGRFGQNLPNRSVYNFNRAEDGLPAFPPSYDEAMSRDRPGNPQPNTVPNALDGNLLGYQTVDRGFVPPRQNVMYSPVGGYMAAAGADTAANVMLQPGATYMTMSGNPQQFQGFMVTSQSTVIPTNYMMNAPTGQETSVGGASSQYDCCFQRAHADGPAAATTAAAATAANGNTAAAKDTAGGGSSASAVSVAGVAEQGYDESNAATADEAPGSPTEPRSVRNRLIDFRNFTFKVNGPNCINVVCNSSVTHIQLARPKKSKLIPVLPTVPLAIAIPVIKHEVSKRGRGRPSNLASRPNRNRSRAVWCTGKELKRKRKRNKSFTLNEDVVKKEIGVNESPMTSAETSATTSAAVSAAKSTANSTDEAQSSKSSNRASLTSPQSSKRRAKHRYFYVPLPDPNHLQSNKYSLSEKTAFNTRSKTVQANVRSTRSKVSLKEFNFLEGSDNYVPLFKHADVQVSKPGTPVKVARADVPTFENKTNQNHEEKPNMPDLGNSTHGEICQKVPAESSQSTTSSVVFKVRSSPDEKCSWPSVSNADTLLDATVAVDKKLACETPAKRKLLQISDFVLTSAEKRSRDVIDDGDSDADSEDTCYTAVTMRPPVHFADTALKAESSSSSLSSASTVRVSSDDRRQGVSSMGARPRLRGKRRQTSSTKSVLSGDSGRTDSDKTVSKTTEDSDCSDYNFEDANEEDEDDEEYIKKAIMKYSIIDKMSTMKAKSLTARKFLPSSRTEQLQRERIKVMKRLALR